MTVTAETVSGGDDQPPARSGATGRADWRAVAPAGALLAGGALCLGDALAGHQAALFLVGGALGLVLYHAAFGFASSWRARLLSRPRDPTRRALRLAPARTSALYRFRIPLTILVA